jgi:hypothetical protein
VEEARASSPRKAKLFEPPLHAAAPPISTFSEMSMASLEEDRFGFDSRAEPGFGRLRLPGWDSVPGSAPLTCSLPT